MRSQNAKYTTSKEASFRFISVGRFSVPATPGLRGGEKVDGLIECYIGRVSSIYRPYQQRQWVGIVCTELGHGNSKRRVASRSGAALRAVHDGEQELVCNARVAFYGGKLKIVMKIAQIAPLIESVPPPLYGGTERIVSCLTEELVRLGHEVTLFASADLITSAELAPCCNHALRLDDTVRDIIPHYMLMVDKVRERADDFDLLHFHIDLFHFPLFRSLEARTLTTLHGRQDLSDLKPFYHRFSKMPLVSISAAQRKPLPHANFVATIHHGIPADLHRPAFERGSYLAFLGRISPEKRPDRAIRIAQRVGIPLKIAAKVDKVDEAYFRTEILPLVDGKGIEFLGEINEREKTTFLGDAAALLFPIDWPEPFGLVMIEAMACGTPVLAFRSRFSVRDR